MACQGLKEILSKLAIMCVILVLAGCVPVTLPPDEQYSEVTKITLRRPALDELHLVEGLNVVDRTPSGMSLAAEVTQTEITDWRVFDAEGEVVFKQQGDDGMGFGESCVLTGGFPGGHIDGRLACCWDNWGCLLCTENGECEMQCDTQACKDANDQAPPPVFPEDPDGRPSVAVSPDQLVIVVDPETPGWTVMDAAGARMHLATGKNEGVCPICIRSSESHVCWELPCLPASIKAD